MRRAAPLLFALLTLTACQGSVEIPDEDSTEDPTDDPSDPSDPTDDPSDPTDDPQDACAPPENPAVFEVGTGEKCFERLAENGDIALIVGPQGGYHLWLSIGCADCEGKVVLTFGVRDAATGEALEGTFPAGGYLELSGKTWPQAAGFQVSIPGDSWEPELAPPPAKGTKVVLWAELGDGKGNVVHAAEAPVVIGDMKGWDPCAEDPNGDDCWF